MAGVYDYVQIVVDDDWRLLGIVPNNGAGDKIKKMAIEGSGSMEVNVLEETLVKRPRPKILIEMTPQITQAEPEKRDREKDMIMTVANNRPELFLGNNSDTKKRLRENILPGFGQ